MTLTKNSENYTIQDIINDIAVNGDATKHADGNISLNLHIDDGSWISYNEDVNERCSLTINFDKDKDPTDYAQAVITNILLQLKGNND